MGITGVHLPGTVPPYDTMAGYPQARIPAKGLNSMEATSSPSPPRSSSSEEPTGPFLQKYASMSKGKRHVSTYHMAALDEGNRSSSINTGSGRWLCKSGHRLSLQTWNRVVSGSGVEELTSFKGSLAAGSDKEEGEYSGGRFWLSMTVLLGKEILRSLDNKSEIIVDVTLV